MQMLHEFHTISIPNDHFTDKLIKMHALIYILTLDKKFNKAKLIVNLGFQTQGWRNARGLHHVAAKL